VINPSGAVSNAASLNVAAPPAITSLNPNPMPRSASSQILTINGSGFNAGGAVRVVASAGGVSSVLQGAQITSVTATRITALINVGTTARNWTIQVVNGDGTPSNPATLQVN
jgi:hypothetical protein